MPRRIRAPGLDSPALRVVNKTLRDIHAEIRRLERLLPRAGVKERRAILRRIDRLLAQRETAMRKWVFEVIPRVGKAGARYAVQELGFDSRTSLLLRRTIEEIQAQTFQEVAQSTRYIRLDAKRLMRQIAKETTDLHVRRGMSIPESASLVQNRLESIGLKAFKDVSGREWSLESYSEMLMRTRTAQAFNAGTVIKSTEEGANAFEVFDGTGDAECADANGMIVSSEWAMENPIAHPQCVRAFGPIMGYAGQVTQLGEGEAA